MSLPLSPPAKLGVWYESVGFPTTSPVQNGTKLLNTSWHDLLWSAITVGRPDRNYVFAHGRASEYEALFRMSLVRMALEQSGPKSRRLRRTGAARALDPTEKGAVNYFLGMVVAKLFAHRLLHAPWMLHLDVFRPQLNAILNSRSRPDLVGQTESGDWIALECKGRISPPDAATKEKAKDQARRIVSVGGKAPIYAVGAVTYFASNHLQFYWEDPPPAFDESDRIRVPYDPTVWRHHYAPTLKLLRTIPDSSAPLAHGELVEVPGADVKIGIHPKVLAQLQDGQWNAAREVAMEAAAAQVKEDAGRASDETSESGPCYREDGIAVVAGESWQKPFEEESELDDVWSPEE